MVCVCVCDDQRFQQQKKHPNLFAFEYFVGEKCVEIVYRNNVFV